MSESKGSRDISLGPYRSTELVLEEMLNKKELSNLAYDLERKDFGRIPVYDFDSSTEQFIDMLSALGYKEKIGDIFVRQDGSFVYFRAVNDYQIIVGDYFGNLENVRFNIGTIKDMESYKRQNHRRVCSATYECINVSILMASFFGPTSLGFYLGQGMASFFYGVTGVAVTALSKWGAEAMKYDSDMSRIASSLSKDAKNYSYGKEAYRKINSDYYELTRSKELETSEVAQLPEVGNKK